MQGYYIMDMKFEIATNTGYPLESTVIRKSGSNYQGVCHVTWINHANPTHNQLWTTLSLTCTLVVTRCPLSQTVIK